MKRVEEIKKDIDWYAISKEDVFKRLKSSEEGLTSKEAEKRLEEYGSNIIKETHRFRLLKMFFQQFNSFLIYILLVAAGISFLIKNNIDGIVISIVILINFAIGFFQQYKAENAISNLKMLMVPRSRVIRDGKLIEISSDNLVIGDIIILNSGDRINVDCRIIELENLQTDEATLTGESLPINKFLKTLVKETILAKQVNLLFAGTQVVRGNAKAVVIDTGMNTVFGKIAETLQDIPDQKTPMQNRLDKFSKQIGFIILAFISIIILFGFTKYFDLINMFLIAVALAVSAIPEGLPAILTISFAISSLAMSKKSVIVRKLPAVESLGSVSIICTDKTGTITEEKMSIQKIFSNNNFYSKISKSLFLDNKKVDLIKNKEISQLLKTSVLCNNARFELVDKGYNIIGDPTEKALVSVALDLGINKKILIESEPSVKKFDFDAKRKMMSIVRNNGKESIMYSKGAPETIIGVSSFEFVNGQIKKLTLNRKSELLNYSKQMEQEALRVLGFAFKNIPAKQKVEENELIFLGFTGMIDPPRPEVKGAIKQCKDAGIDIKIITGDSLLTAIAIAKQIGITGRAITEEELENMSDTDLINSINEIAIFARTTPHQKLRITKILQEKGEVVAITGDGINDALALKSADVGIAMGQRGTDVARDVADIVLIDDNFASIVEGVKQGRKTYDNVKKFTKFFLAVNFSEIFLVLFALIIGMLYSSDKWFLPLLPLQILWMNLVTDSLPALSLVFEEQEDVMNSKPRNEKSILSGVWKFILVAGLFAFLAELIVYLICIKNNTSLEQTRTIVLTTAILFELLFVYVARSEKSLLKIGIFSNKYLNYTVLISFCLHLVLIYTSLGSLFGVVPLTFKNWLFILPFSFSGLIFFEAWKIFKWKSIMKK